MNPFYWHEGIPDKEGYYLCAWKMADGYIYETGHWDGKDWYTLLPYEPNLFHKITPPHEFFEELEREATDRQRAHVTATTDEDEDATNHLPLLGAN